MATIPKPGRVGIKTASELVIALSPTGGHPTATHGIAPPPRWAIPHLLTAGIVKVKHSLLFAVNMAVTD